MGAYVTKPEAFQLAVREFATLKRDLGVDYAYLTRHDVLSRLPMDVFFSRRTNRPKTA